MTFSFVSGDPALDLAGTVLARWDDPIDLLPTPADLEQWITESDELPDQVAVDTTSFTSALALREAVYQLASDRLHDRSLNHSGLDILNDTAAPPPLQITLSNAGLHETGTISAVLSHIARSGMKALADPRSRFKECSREACSRLYLDRSRGSRRAWCGMDECGNRIKAAAYRARKRTSISADDATP